MKNSLAVAKGIPRYARSNIGRMETQLRVSFKKLFQALTKRGAI